MQGSKRYSGFDPRTVGGCALWLDAADPAVFTLSGSAITQWNDKSGRGNHATQSTAGNRPLYLPSARSVGFTATSAQFMTLPDGTLPIGNNSYAYFLVCSFNTLADIRGLIGGGGYGTIGAVFALRSGGSGMIHHYWWGRDVSTPVGVYSATQQLIVGATYTSGGTRATLVDGVVRASDVPQARIQTAVNNTLGTTYSTEYHDGTISEVLVFDASLSVSERQQVEGYLSWKWGSRRITAPTITLAPEFNPLAIGTAPALWLDGADPLGTGVAPSTGTALATWVDKSGNARHATATGTPTYLSGGGINFNGTNAVYRNSNFQLDLTGRSIFIVLKVNTYLQYAGVFMLFPTPPTGNADTTSSGLAFSTTSTTAFEVYANSGGYFSTPSATITNVNILNENMTFRSGSGFVNGTAATPVTATYTPGTTSGYGIGSRWSGTTMLPEYQFTGNIYEILIFPSQLTIAQRRQVESYLGAKWGLSASLPQPTLTLPPSFTPVLVPQAALWLDAADSGSVVLASGTSNVTQWNDKSGNGNTATAFGTPVWSATQLNGRGGIVLNGSSRFSGSTSNTSNVLTAFMVATLNSNSEANTHLLSLVTSGGLDYDSTLRAVVFIRQPADLQAILSLRNFTALSKVAISHGVPFIASSIFNGTDNIVHLNGTSGAVVASDGSFGYTTYGVGRDPTNPNGFLTGAVYEVILFNAALTTTQRQTVELYLSRKWGIPLSLPMTLPLVHPYYLRQPILRPFNPLDVEGCALWLDAADPSVITLSGSNVTQWRDKSGNGNNAQTTLGTPVLQSLDGIQGVYFATRTEQMTTVSNVATLGSVARTLICVIRAPSASSEVIIGSGNHTVGASPTSFGIHLEGPNSRVFAPYTYSADQAPISFFSTAGMIVYADYTPSPSTVAGSYNGTSLQSRAVTTLATTSSPWYLGRRPDNVGCVTGYIHEVIHYSSVLTTSQRQQVESYLAAKWGLRGQTPSTHLARLSPGLTPQFNPLNVGSCALWLDAADRSSLTLSGSNVTQWNDKSGNLRHATAFNSPVYSSTTGSVTLNGTNQYFTCPNASYRPITIFAVVTYTGTSGGAILRKGFATGTSFEFTIGIQSTTALRYQIITSTSGIINISPTVATTSGRQLYGLTYDNATAVAYQNGVSVGTASSAGPVFTGSSLLFLGVVPDNANNPNTEYFTGSLHELILFTTAPTTNQRQQVEGYLARKWGLLGTLSGPSLTVAPVPPISVPGCQMWLDAAGTSTLTLNGSNVSQWRDKTSNAYAISQATPSNQPAFLTNQLNGFGGVQQGPTTHLFVAGTSISNFAYGQETSVFFVVRNASANTSWNIFATMFFTAGGGQSTKSRWHLSFNQGGTQGLTLIVGNTPQTAIQNTSFVTPPSTPAIVGFTLSQSSILLDLNGTVSTHAGYTIGNADDGIGLALADPRANIASNSMVFEMVGFNRVISTSERQQVEGYLAQKWGLLSVLPATHPFQSPFASTHPYKMTPLL